MRGTALPTMRQLELQQAPAARSSWRSRRCRRHHLRCPHAVAAPPSPAQTSTVQAAPPLPDALRRNVAVLEAPNPSAPGGTTQVYVLGVSHITQASVEQVKELIGLVRPQVVAVELCKDRLAGLVDPEANTKGVWHSRRVTVEGLPADSPAWPTPEQLTPLLLCKLGRPVSTYDIEDDVRTLLATGLFKTVRPLCEPPNLLEAPSFKVVAVPGGGHKLQMVPPLGSIKFIATPRTLPELTGISLRLDSSLRGAQVPTAELEAACAATLAAAKAGSAGSSLQLLLDLRAKLKGLCAAKEGQQQGGDGDNSVVVVFNGAELGEVEVAVKAAKPGDPAFVSGLERSAPGGEGFGIDPFRPLRSLYKISGKMFLELDTVEAMREAAQLGGLAVPSSTSSSSSEGGPGGDGDSGSGAPAAVPVVADGAFALAVPPQAFQAATQHRRWGAGQMDAIPKQEPLPGVAAGFLSGVLTKAFSRVQDKAGRKAGVQPGAAWRAAMEAATACGAQQLLLLDMPTRVTERRLAEEMLAAAGWRLGVAASALVAAIAAALATDAVPELFEVGGVAAAAALGAALLYPLYAPVQTLGDLAAKSGAEIEAALATTEAVQAGDLSQPLRLPAEDALLDWPGAMGPLLHERDAHMARSLAAAASPSHTAAATPATAQQQQGQQQLAAEEGTSSPAFVLDKVDEQLVWRYMMPEVAASDPVLAGLGDGCYQPLPGVQRVVAVVGMAHVRGIAKGWRG